MNIEKVKKPKLPRKRKKECIKSMGRKNYLDTVSLARVTGESPCKFWKSIENAVVIMSGVPVLVPTATSFW